MLSSEIIAKAVCDYYYQMSIDCGYVDSFYIVYFYQKYDWSDKWEECTEIAECQDGHSVEFQMDFCEGQTDVKDIVVLSLDEIGAMMADIAIVEAYRKEKMK